MEKFEIVFKNDFLTKEEMDKIIKIDNIVHGQASGVLLSDFLGNIRIDNYHYFHDDSENEIMLPTASRYDGVKKFILNSKITTTYLTEYNNILNTFSSENGWDNNSLKDTALDSLTNCYVHSMKDALADDCFFNNLTIEYYADDKKFGIHFNFSNKIYEVCVAGNNDYIGGLYSDEHLLSLTCSPDKKYVLSCRYYTYKARKEIEREITISNYKKVRKGLFKNTMATVALRKKSVVLQNNETSKLVKANKDMIDECDAFISDCKKALA
jgi:hypothetical protein